MPNSNSRGLDARSRHGPRHRPRPQYDAGPHHATRGIVHIRAIDNGRLGIGGAYGPEAGCQQDLVRGRIGVSFQVSSAATLGYMPRRPRALMQIEAVFAKFHWSFFTDHSTTLITGNFRP